MRFFLFCTALIVSTIVLVSCDNDFDLVEDGDSIPIVYGLLDEADSAHYIRIEQSFVDDETSALVLAQDPDNLYYSDIQVFLNNLTSRAQVQLEQVDGAEEGYPREDGVFAQAPNILYKVSDADALLSAEDEVELEVRRGEEVIARSSTRLVGDATITKPLFNRPTAAFNAANPAGILLSFRHPQDDVIFDVSVVLTISEPTSNREITIDLLKGSTETEVEFPLNAFYSTIASRLSGDSVVSRQLVSARFILTASGSELADYLRVQTANLGITSSQEPPRYTNIENGLGVLSSRSKLVTRELEPTTSTRDSLANGLITQDLGFVF